MPQIRHFQHGLFHVTTCAADNIPWCTMPGTPEIIIQNLFATRDLYQAKIYAFCVLPTHMHILLDPRERGISTFMQSFKSNAMKNIREQFPYRGRILLRRRVAAAQPNGGVQAGLRVPLEGQDSSIPPVYRHRWQNGFHDERI